MLFIFIYWWRDIMSIMQEILNTKSQKIINEHVYQIQYGDHAVLVIKHPKCVAAISLYGAHLLFWQPTTENLPVIWLSDQSHFKKTLPIRGGVPICWPWFSNAGTPMHGFARICDWTLKSCTSTQDDVKCVFELTHSDETKQYWDADFNLTFDVNLSETCQLMLANSGNFTATAALHTYFGVNDIAEVNITGLGANYTDKLSTVNEPLIVGELTFNQEVDRIYTQAESINNVIDHQRTIQIEHIHHSDVVTWNPWIEKTKSLNDLADSSYHDFVCVETARINQPIKSTDHHDIAIGVKIAVKNR